MVSIRRRKLLGYCSEKISLSASFPRVFERGDTPENVEEKEKRIDVNSLHFIDDERRKQEPNSVDGASSSKASDSSPPEDDPFLHFPEVKRRKQHRRKYVENQEACTMRGVYLKNAKWQAAIKVDKKQIHLGTVGSQEEAARLYDRAAFLCGREPNFELSEEEKRELRKFKWDDFLAMTRSAIMHKKSQRRNGRSSQSKQQNNAWEEELSASEDDTLSP